MLEKQSNGNGEAIVSTVLLFDSECRVIVHDRLPISHIRRMTIKEYCAGGGTALLDAAGGGTALLDAAGGAIHHIGNVHKPGPRIGRPKPYSLSLLAAVKMPAGGAITKQSVP